MVCRKANLVTRSKVDLVVRPIQVRLLGQEYDIINEDFNVDNLGNYPRHDKRCELNREI